MDKKNISLRIVCEDVQQQVFTKRYFEARGFNSHKMRFLPVPDGKNSGEQYVRKIYLQEVRTYRSKSTYLDSLRLVVVIDADKKTVQERLSQLDSELENSGQTKRQPNEKIAVFVPKRNIETWIHYLMGETVDELTTYFKFDSQSECKPFAEKLALEICPIGLPTDAPLSLHAAGEELSRIL